MASNIDSKRKDSTLEHIYFFINDDVDVIDAANHRLPILNGAGKADVDSTVLPSTEPSAEQRSRESSPCSTETESATANTTSSSSDMNPLAEEFVPAAQLLPIPPAPTTSNLFELRKTADKGLGLFASQFIKRGTLIIAEEPLLKISQNAIHQAWPSYCQLGNAQKAAYDSLHPFQPENLNLELASRQYLIDPTDESLDEEDVAELVAEQVKVMSIFAPNNFHLPPSSLAVYATASRLNHSCLPNIHHSYNPTLKRLTVHAATDIPADQELLTSYLGGPATYWPHAQRVKKLLAAYGFTCRCPACADSTGTSDGRRELMACIAWGLERYNNNQPSNHPFIPGNDTAALQQAEDLVSSMLAEGISTIELTKAYRFASHCALRLKKFELALEFAAREREVERACMGDDLQDLKNLGVATECWINQVYEAVRVEHGEEAVRALAKKEKQKKKKMNKKKWYQERKNDKGALGKAAAPQTADGDGKA